MHPILADRRRLQLHLIAWALVGVMLGLIVHTLSGTPWVPSLLFGLPLGLVAASVSLSAWYVCRALPLSRTPGFRVGLAATAAALVASAMWAAIGRGWWLLLQRTGQDLREAQGETLAVILVGLGALSYLAAVAVQYSIQALEDSAEAARRALESQVGQREAELRALRAQVDPHFLFNSLNAISGLVASDPAKAREMCQLLAAFLRESLRLDGSTRISLEREVALAEQYLRVEQVRFGSRLGVKATVGAESAAVQVPSLILQPLVENAVRHGIATRIDGGVIEIAAHRAGERVIVAVANPRDADGGRSGLGFGLDIVRRRLAASFGDRAVLAIDSGAESYRVTLTIPVSDTT